MESAILQRLGIDPAFIFLFMLILIIALFVLYVNVSMKYDRLKNSYNSFMKGKDGKTLEESLLSKFSEIDGLAKLTKQNRQDALAMLDGNNSGWVINAMHSREGCYTYIKEIVKGESYVELAEEETEALDRAIFSEAYSMDVKETKENKKRANKSERDEV